MQLTYGIAVLSTSAALQSDLQAFVAHLKDGAHINEPDADGRLPFIAAAQAGLEFVEVAIGAGAVIDAREPHSGRTALMAAVQAQNTQVCAAALVATGMHQLASCGAHQQVHRRKIPCGHVPCCAVCECLR